MNTPAQPLTPADLAWIEAQLDITLPQAYQWSLLAPTPGHTGPAEQAAIWRDPSLLVRANQDLRRVWPAFWPRSYLVIGQDDVGGLYVIDLSHPRSPVLSLLSGACEDAQEIRAEEVAPSITAWDTMNRSIRCPPRSEGSSGTSPS